MSKGLTLAKITMKIMGIEGFNPITSKSGLWINWITNFGPGTCPYCAEQNGKIFKRDNPPENIPVHDRCNCYTEPVVTIIIGIATIDRGFGADK